MAIKDKNFDGMVPTDGHHTIERLLDMLQMVEPQIAYDRGIELICDTTVRHLVEVYVPPTAQELKKFRSDLVQVGEMLERIVKCSDNYEQIILVSLQTLYKLIVSTEKPSAAAGIIFNIYGETLPDAIKILMSNSANTDFDKDIQKVITILCQWLKTYSDFCNLNKCIIDMLNGLAELKKFDLLMELSLNVVESLFISLIIPCIRPNTFPVVIHILKSAQSLAVFEKIMGRIPKVMPAIESSIRSLSMMTDEARLFQQLIDIIYALLDKFPVFNDSYKDIEKTMANFTRSNFWHTVLDAKSWEPAITISQRDPKTLIGLVNMGNTCYMNSVLQALFMTQKFTREILEVKLPSRMIQSVQQLFALLLCSVRPELVPRDILSRRPQTFRYGHQQDSFEYLGYVLDQLHEEEKKCLTNGQPENKDVPNGYESFNNNSDDTYIRDATYIMGCDDWSAASDPLKSDLPGIEQEFSERSPYFDLCTDEDMGVVQCEVNGPVRKWTSPPSSPHSSQSQPAPPLTPAPPPLLPPTPPAESVQTIIQRIFGGKMSVTYKCLECQSTSTNVDNFFDLQLSFPHTTENGTPSPIKSNYYTTQALLDSYFSTEKLIDDDKYYCDKCGKLCDGERNINLQNGPSNLILVIKHFKYDRKFHVRRKLLHKVHHNDIITVTTSEDVNGECFRHTYRLYAVIVHSGMNIDSGHYYTFGADQQRNWFKFNDSFISPSSLADIKNLSDLNTPYILFYELMATEKSKPNISNDDELSHTLHDEASMDLDTPSPTTKFEWPDLSELPPMLRDYVRKDNNAYTHEYRRKNYDDEDLFRYNKHRKSDNDQDPPSSCGGNMIESSNRYIC